MKENGIIVEDIFRMHYNAHLNYWGVYEHHKLKIHKMKNIRNKTVVIIYKYFLLEKSISSKVDLAAVQKKKFLYQRYLIVLFVFKAHETN